EAGRKHPPEDQIIPSYFGDSIGHWEGETLVIDTVGYNEKFWFIRGGLPHTHFMHLTERFTRVDFDTLKYEVTIDDKGAYTKPWSGGWYIPWQYTNYDGTAGERDRDASAAYRHASDSAKIRSIQNCRDLRVGQCVARCNSGENGRKRHIKAFEWI